MALPRVVIVAVVVALVSLARDASAQTRVPFPRAIESYVAASKLEAGPARVDAMRSAAALLRAAIEADPASADAPEATLLLAHASKEAGERKDALAAYQRFVDVYGAEASLAAVEKESPPAYTRRLEQVERAFTALASASVLFFDYAAAARVYEAESACARLPQASRRMAARNGAVLFEALGDGAGLGRASATFFTLAPSPSERVEVAWVVASLDVQGWNPLGPDEGGNRAARRKAFAAIESFYATYGSSKESLATIVEATWTAARTQFGRDEAVAATWCKRATDAFATLAARDPSSALGTRVADQAAECAYRAADAEISAKFTPSEPGRSSPYNGTPDAVVTAFEADVKAATDTWFPMLTKVIEDHRSARWSIAARVRQATLYDHCRSRLYYANVDVGSPLDEWVYTGGDADPDPTPADLRREVWRTRRAALIDRVDRPMVKFYAEAYVWGRAFRAAPAASALAVRRLAFFTDVVGELKIAEYVKDVSDPVTRSPFVYRDGMFTLARPSPLPPSDGSVPALGMGAFVPALAP